MDHERPETELFLEVAEFRDRLRERYEALEHRRDCRCNFCNDVRGLMWAVSAFTLMWENETEPYSWDFEELLERE